MENEMKVVDIFIGTTLRGSAKGSGRVMYIMRTKKKNGSDYEARRRSQSMMTSQRAHLYFMLSGMLCSVSTMPARW